MERTAEKGSTMEFEAEDFPRLMLFVSVLNAKFLEEKKSAMSIRLWDGKTVSASLHDGKADGETTITTIRFFFPEEIIEPHIRMLLEKCKPFVTIFGFDNQSCTLRWQIN